MDDNKSGRVVVKKKQNLTTIVKGKSYGNLQNHK